MEDPERAAEPEIDPAEVPSATLEEWSERLGRTARLAQVMTTLTMLFVAAIAAYGGYLFGLAASDVRTVERIGDPRMHMSMPVPGGEAAVYVHPVRRASDGTERTPDITFTLEIPDALAALPDEDFCGVPPDLTLCSPHLIQLGPDSTAYVMEPDADRLNATEQ